MLTTGHLRVSSAADTGASISGEGLSRLFHVAPGALLEIENVILTNGTADVPADGNGGCVLLEANSSLFVKGGGFVGCSAAGSGGGVFSAIGGLVELSGSLLSGCSAEYGGACYLLGASIRMMDSRVDSCMGFEHGGALYAYTGAQLL